jgi:GxxExxY protein
MNRQDAEIAKIREPDADLDQIAYNVIGAAIEVHRELGSGYLESVYESALCIELTAQGISYTRQSAINIEYKGQSIGEGRADIIVEEQLIVELKTVDALAPIHKAQLMSYLKATGYQLGLLINFNVPILKEGIKRVIQS